MSLAPRVIEQAAAYADYMAKAGGMSPQFKDASQVSAALTLAEAFEPQQLRRGAIAYGAVAALQDRDFVAGVRTYVADPEQRRSVVNEIYRDPAYALGFKGADSAAGRIIAEIGEAGTDVFVNGKRVKQAAYDVQRQAWSRTPIQNREARLARAKANSTLPMTASLERITRLQGSASGAIPPANIGYSVTPPYNPLVIRALAVAALAALGEAGESQQTGIQAIMAEPSTDSCLNLSKLNLYQCLAVAGPQYEDVFCLGQHILMDTGQCMIRSVGAAMPIEPPLPVITVASKAAPARRPAARTPARPVLRPSVPAKKG
jgi:hypothetical protein